MSLHSLETCDLLIPDSPIASGEWWLAGDPEPWPPEALTVVSERLGSSHD